MINEAMKKKMINVVVFCLFASDDDGNILLDSLVSATSIIHGCSVKKQSMDNYNYNNDNDDDDDK